MRELHGRLWLGSQPDDSPYPLLRTLADSDEDGGYTTRSHCQCTRCGRRWEVTRSENEVSHAKYQIEVTIRPVEMTQGFCELSQEVLQRLDEAAQTNGLQREELVGLIVERYVSKPT